MSPARLRAATAADLDAVNGVIERAVMTWQLPERVKRLAMPSYRYGEQDLAHLHLEVADDGTDGIVGVAAWEAADPRDVPAGRRGLLLHGLYVDPARQRGGVGTALLEAAIAAARAQHYDGLLVKAQADADGFFAACGLQRLAVDNPERDYVHRYWMHLTGRANIK